MLELTMKNLFQWAFALSPFPAYLPQYFSMMQQLSSDDDDTTTINHNNNNNNNNHSNNNNSISATNIVGLNGTVAIDRGGDFLRKRTLYDSPSHLLVDRNATTSTDDDAVSGLSLAGTPSKPFHDGGISCGAINNNNNNNATTVNSDDRDTSNSDGGLSRATVFLLLAAHLIRMLYFHGLMLEEERPLPIRASAGLGREDLLLLAGEVLNDKVVTGGRKLEVDIEVDVDLAGGTSQHASSTLITTSISSKPSTIQYDLLGQSCSMIVVQLMLLHGMMRLRRKNHKSRRKRLHSDTNNSTSCSSISKLSGMAPRSNSFVLPSSTQMNNNRQSKNINAINAPQLIAGTTIPSTAINESTPLQKQWRRFTRATASHFLRLLSPVNILQHHSFLEYVELLLLSCTVITLLFDYHWYPRYRMEVVEWLKYTSIIFESCLALPQAMKNYGNGTTEGLSVVMVGGWVVGDFMKLCYFLLSMIGTASGENGDGADEGVAVSQENVGDDDALDGNNVFALGCLLALAMDLLVGMQMAYWYPSQEVVQLRERIMRSVRHWKTNKDDDIGAPILMNSTEYKKAGIFASLMRGFYRRRKGSRPPLDSLQKNSK